jgi:HlyD family secretion protein
MTRTRPRIRIPWLWLLVLAALAAGAFFWLRSRRSAAPTNSPTVQVETAAVERGMFRVSVSGPGSLTAAQTLEVKPQTAGTILSVPQVGNRVTKGQLLVRLDPTDAQRSLENAQLQLQKAQANLAGLKSNQANTQASQEQSLSNAQASYANAQSEYSRAKSDLEANQRIYSAGGISAAALQTSKDASARANANLETARIALDTAKASLNLKASSNTQDLKNAQIAVQQAELDLKTAQQNLGRTKVYAPFSGVVSAVSGQVGAAATTGQAVFTLVDDSKLELPVQIDETEIGKVTVGMRTDVTLDALDGQTFEGQVSRISPTATIQQNIPVFYATVTLDNAEGKLKPGMSAEAEIIAQEIPRALLVPKRAVQQLRRRAYVDVQLPDGSKDTVRVTAGPDDGVSQVIEEGLEEGQTVVLPPRVQPTTTQTNQNRGLGLPLGGGGPGR